jgi:hypothetical protein
MSTCCVFPVPQHFVKQKNIFSQKISKETLKIPAGWDCQWIGGIIFTGNHRIFQGIFHVISEPRVCQPTSARKKSTENAPGAIAGSVTNHVFFENIGQKNDQKIKGTQ